jgi:excisionase family DNA binding protein
MPNTAHMRPDLLLRSRWFYEVRDVMRMLRLSRTVIYELIRSGRLRSVKQGRARRIPATAIRDYIALLESEAERRSHGDGGLYWDENRQRWRAEITIGYKADGKRITRKASGRTKTEARDS